MSEIKIRFRPFVPSYKRVYSAYQFDQKKYNNIFKKIQSLSCRFQDKKIHNRVSPYRVLNLCYVFDAYEKRVHLGDERHIYRYKTLEKVRRLIAKELLNNYDLYPIVSVLEYLYKRTGIFLEVEQDLEGAEIVSIWRLPIRERLIINLQLLKNLRKGLEIEIAVENALKYIADKQKKDDL